MKIGINTVLWFWPFNVKKVDIFKKIKEIGFEVVEFAIVDRTEGNIKIIRDALEKYNLECIIDGVVGGERDILSPDKELMKAGIEYLKESIILCSKLNCKFLVGPTYSVGIKKFLFDSEKRPKSWKRCVDAYRLIAELAEEKNVKIAIEPLNRYETNFLNTAQQVKRLVEEINSSYVGIHLDTYHMNIEEKSFHEALLTAGNKLFHMHVPENDRGTPGTGNIRWDDIAKGLKEINYEYNIDLEIAHPHVENIREPGAIWRVYDYQPDKMAKEGYKYLKSILFN